MVSPGTTTAPACSLVIAAKARSISCGHPRLHELKLPSHRLRRSVHATHRGHVAWIVRIPEDGHPRNLGRHLLEQLELLRDQVVEHDRGPSEVAARTRQTGDESAPHGV